MTIGKPDNLHIAPVLILVVALLFSFATLAAPTHVFEKNGCIWLTDGLGKPSQLTTCGRDRAPVLSPDGKNVSFLRKSTRKAILTIGDETDFPGDSTLADQVWIVSIKTKEARCLVVDREGGGKNVTENCQRMIGHIDDKSLCFSPDGARIYFIGSAWATSGALHQVDLANGQEAFLMPANSVEIVMQGKYRGHLIVQQHRYFLGTGSYDWYWLFSPDGKEIGPVGTTQEQVNEFRRIYADAGAKTGR